MNLFMSPFFSSFSFLLFFSTYVRLHPYFDNNINNLLPSMLFVQYFFMEIKKADVIDKKY